MTNWKQYILNDLTVENGVNIYSVDEFELVGVGTKPARHCTLYLPHDSRSVEGKHCS